MKNKYNELITLQKQLLDDFWPRIVEKFEAYKVFEKIDSKYILCKSTEYVRFRDNDIVLLMLKLLNPGDENDMEYTWIIIDGQAYLHTDEVFNVSLNELTEPNLDLRQDGFISLYKRKLIRMKAIKNINHQVVLGKITQQQADELMKKMGI